MFHHSSTNVGCLSCCSCTYHSHTTVRVHGSTTAAADFVLRKHLRSCTCCSQVLGGTCCQPLVNPYPCCHHYKLTAMSPHRMAWLDVPLDAGICKVWVCTSRYGKVRSVERAGREQPPSQLLYSVSQSHNHTITHSFATHHLT